MDIYDNDQINGENDIKDYNYDHEIIIAEEDLLLTHVDNVKETKYTN